MRRAAHDGRIGAPTVAAVPHSSAGIAHDDLPGRMWLIRLRRVLRYAPRMLWTVVVILLILWFLGFLLRAFGGLIHLLLIVALIVVIYRLLTGRKLI